MERRRMGIPQMKRRGGRALLRGDFSTKPSGNAPSRFREDKAPKDRAPKAKKGRRACKRATLPLSVTVPVNRIAVRPHGPPKNERSSLRTSRAAGHDNETLDHLLSKKLLPDQYRVLRRL